MALAIKQKKDMKWSIQNHFIQSRRNRMAKYQNNQNVLLNTVLTQTPYKIKVDTRSLIDSSNSSDKTIQQKMNEAVKNNSNYSVIFSKGLSEKK